VHITVGESKEPSVHVTPDPEFSPSPHITPKGDSGPSVHITVGGGFIPSVHITWGVFNNGPSVRTSNSQKPRLNNWESDPTFQEGFSDDEIDAILSAAKNSPYDFGGITFWRADGGSADKCACADIGSPNITIFDTFFNLHPRKQAEILEEEYNHTKQLQVGFDDDTVNDYEDDAKGRK
jgi:hypothetical protein